MNIFDVFDRKIIEKVIVTTNLNYLYLSSSNKDTGS